MTCAWLLGTLLVAGCSHQPRSDYAELPLADVRGRVTLDGQPLAGAHVVFEHEDWTFSYGRTDGHGRYRLMYNSEWPGVLPGRKVVRITTRSIGDDGAEGEAAERIPAEYNARSRLWASVHPGQQTRDFALRSGGPIEPAEPRLDRE
jgi:hypothetical protein